MFNKKSFFKPMFIPNAVFRTFEKLGDEAVGCLRNAWEHVAPQDKADFALETVRKIRDTACGLTVLGGGTICVCALAATFKGGGNGAAGETMKAIEAAAATFQR